MSKPEKKRVVVFGELLLRLCTEGHGRIVQARKFEAGYTGAETNAAVSLSNYGVDCQVVSAVPQNLVGDACLAFLKQYGLGTRFVVRCGSRLGVNFFEVGAAQRPSTVLYDREHSAIRDLQPGQIPWNEIFDGADWFHLSGTAPALCPSVAEITQEACQVAQQHGVTVSCDLNYRSKLWTPDEAKQTMTPLMEHVDVLIGNEEDAHNVFGISAANTDVAAGRLDVASYHDVARQLKERFGFRYVATTLRQSLSASHNHWSGVLFDGEEFLTSTTYDIHPIVDRIGAGDAFSGGLIFGLMHELPLQKSLEFAVAASCLKHSIPGDFNLVSEDEVWSLVQGDGSGRVER